MCEEEEILFSKYRVLKVLKSTEKTRILLAVHTSMDSKRILKEIFKDQEGFESLQSEISILKKLNVMHIPHIYDVEETEKYFYIVEEFIEGINLQELVEREGCISLDRALMLGRSLSEIVMTLHAQKPEAVLHLDIQPKNILINGDKVFLIDFGNAAYLSETEDKLYCKGTRGFAAPEQYKNERLSVQTDLYGIGACIYYMLTGNRDEKSFDKVPSCIRRILMGCMAEDRNKRFASASVLVERLEILRNELQGNREEQEGKINYPYEISFTGVRERAGTSVIALTFAAYLARNGVQVLYEEQNETGMVGRLVRNERKILFEKGYFYYKGIYIKPFLETGGMKLPEKLQVIIRDEGVLDEKRKYGRTLILVSGTRIWETEDVKSVVSYAKRRGVLEPQSRTLCFWNLSQSFEIEERMGVEGYHIPYLRDIDDTSVDMIFQKVMESIC